MSNSGAGGGERTEKATPERLKKARQDGSIGKSQDLSGWVVVGAGAVMIPMAMDNAWNAFQDQFVAVRRVAADPDPQLVKIALGDALGSVVPSVQMLLAAVFLAAIVAQVGQGGLHLKKFKARFQQFNVVAGLKRNFGLQALWNGVKALLKTAVIGAVLYGIVVGMLPFVQTSGRLSLPGLLDEVSGRLSLLLIVAVAAGLVLSALDVFVTARRNRKHTRMTKQEVKDEAKRSEGDPHIKGQRRSIQMAMSRNRMMAAIPDADVVVVNPTHIAVALKYEAGKGAPKVLAKGRGTIAQKIRDLANDNKVPIVQDVMLARTLEKTCKVGQEIPEDLFESVARVLAFVMSLRRRGAAGWFHGAPGAAPVPEE